MEINSTYAHVQSHYGSVARRTNPSNSSAIATAFGYSVDDLESIPKESNLGLSCGNPHAIASLREGEVVVDLGCGAGFDVFQAARKVGFSGRVIGVDMNKDMLALARKNQDKTPNTDNVSFIESNITSIAVRDGLADCVISNCVVNLVPENDKPRVFAEMARLLKPGGRVAMSDILAKKEIPPPLRDSVALYVGCVAGASKQEDYTRWLADNGFEDIVMAETGSDLNVYKQDPPLEDADNSTKELNCCSNPAPATDFRRSDQIDDAVKEDPVDLNQIDFNEWVGSFKIFAVKK